jgi:hypothetical protein
MEYVLSSRLACVVFSYNTLCLCMVRGNVLQWFVILVTCIHFIFFLIFISLLLFKDSFTGYLILFWWLFFSFSTLSSPFSCVISWREVSCNLHPFSSRASVFNPLTSPSSSLCSLLLLQYDIFKCISYIYPAWGSLVFLFLALSACQ